MSYTPPPPPGTEGSGIAAAAAADAAPPQSQAPAQAQAGPSTFRPPQLPLRARRVPPPIHVPASAPVGVGVPYEYRAEVDGSLHVNAGLAPGPLAPSPSQAFHSFTSSRRTLSRSPSPSATPSPGPSSVSALQTGSTYAHTDAPSSLPYLSLSAQRSHSPDHFHGHGHAPLTAPLPGADVAGPGPASQARRGIKKRPLPLDLSKSSGVGVDPELVAHMDEVAASASAFSATSDTSLSNEMNDLSLLRNTIRQNLRDRPLDSPFGYAPSDSDQEQGTGTGFASGSGSGAPSSSALTPDTLDPALAISPDELTRLPAPLILDCRSPLAYQESHLPGAISLSVPTLIVKRLKKRQGAPTWSTVASFMSGEGRARWEAAPRDSEVVLVGEIGRDEVARTMRDVVADLLEGGSARVLRGNWDASRPSSALRSAPSAVQSPLGPVQVAIAPPTPPSIPAPRLANQVSMPSLRARRAAEQDGAGKLPPKLSVNVPREPPRSATLGAFDRRPLKSPGLLSIDTTVGRVARSPTMPLPSSSRGPPSPIPRSPISQPPGSTRPAVAPFLVSTIIPNFLYLGPEILERHEVEELKRIGVQRILNVAIECEDDLDLGGTFRYYRVPMRDIVEETNLSRGIRDAMAFLDNARLHDSPTYVHCKAGKSRSVTIVLAYLIHANAWSLKTAYDFVAERRPGMSPNIGFVAELMQYAHAELGLRPTKSHNEDEYKPKSAAAAAGPRPTARARDSLPAWGMAASGGPNGLGGEEPDADRKVDEREVRRGGQWVVRRRVPKDRVTMQPGRRSSKAGLESVLGDAGGGAVGSGFATRVPSPSPRSNSSMDVLPR